MASSTLVIKGHTLADVDTSSGGATLNLMGSNVDSTIYRSSAQALGLPFQVEFRNQIGAPGAKGNDKLFVIITDARANSTTKAVSVMTTKVEISVPRDSATFTDSDTKDHLAYVAAILGKSAMRVAIADASVA